MKLVLARLREAEQNWGTLYIDGVRFCDTLEDADRGLERGGIKVPGQTAIPRGLYKVAITYSPKFGKDMVAVLDVPGFAGVRIHGGVDEEDTEGCPLVGMRNGRTLMLGLKFSRALFVLVRNAIARGEPVVLEVT